METLTKNSRRCEVGWISFVESVELPYIKVTLNYNTTILLLFCFSFFFVSSVFLCFLTFHFSLFLLATSFPLHHGFLLFHQRRVARGTRPAPAAAKHLCGAATATDGPTTVAPPPPVTPRPPRHHHQGQIYPQRLPDLADVGHGPVWTCPLGTFHS